MSAQARALLRLASPGAVLARDPRGQGYAVYPQGDRRRRPVARLSAEAVRALEADGALAAAEDGFALTAAGLARVRRENALPGEHFIAQHAPIEDRAVMDRDGRPSSARGVAQSAVLQRLAALRDAQGAPWLNDAELRAAQQVRDDWTLAELGLVRGSDWRAPPRGATPRAAGSDASMAARCDARRRMQSALDALAPALRRVVERVCLHEDGLEALERGERWPARSGKLALKLGLAQLAMRR